MSRARQLVVAGLALLASGTAVSGAVFTAQSSNGDGTLSTAPNFQLIVAMTDPNVTLRGTVTLNATASDTSSSIASVVIQRSPAGANTWTNVCAADTVAPYQCTAFNTNTAATPDGNYQFRAIATNALGETGTSTVVSERIDNGLPNVALVDPGAWSRGWISLAATVSDPAGGTGIAQVRYEFRTGAAAYATACTANAAPWTCSFDTTRMTTGSNYDFRAIATDGAGNTRTSTVIGTRRADNTAPAASAFTDPVVVTGNEVLVGSATDNAPQSGLATLRFEYAPAGTTTWTTACTDTVTPFTSCTFASAGVPDGQYDLRMTAIDVAGNAAAPVVRLNRRLDNTDPTATLSGVTTYTRGTVTYTATAADPNAGTVTQVAFQRSPAGAGTWTTICTDTTSASWTCPFTTPGFPVVADGLYDIRAVATDSAGRTGASSLAATRVDNTAPTATLTSPAAVLTGQHTLQATASDGGSGLTGMRIEMRAELGTWTTFCSTTSGSLSCPLDTTAYTDGDYEFRVVADDAAGNVRTTTAVTNRRVDNHEPTVTMTAPAAFLRGSVTLAVTHADGTGTGVASVRYELRKAGDPGWSLACTSAVAPFSCAVNTTTLTDGASYDFRAIATDGAGFTTTSAERVDHRIDNSAPTGVVVNHPGGAITGVATFSGTASDATSGVVSVRYEVNILGTWYPLCTATNAPWSCPADTVLAPDGIFSLRSIATDGVGFTTTSAVLANVSFDNDPPTATLNPPATPMRGTVTWTATATDAAGGSGVDEVAFQRSPAGANTWTTACVDDTAPYSCAVDTTALADGLYDVRAIATDGAGLTDPSTTSTNRRVDNTAPSAAMTNPGSPLSGTAVGLAATASDPGGFALGSVVIERSPAGAGTWTTACTPPAAGPHTCSWSSWTTATPDGLYDFRSVVTDAAGNVATSPVVADRIVDNGPLALDVQTANAGGTQGIAQVGDSITFTYSEAVAPASILAGWSGGAQAVTLRFENISTSNDRVVIYDAANSALLPLTTTAGVTLGANHVTTAAAFAATMTRSAGGDAITVTLNALSSGAVNGTAAPIGGMTWTPAATVTDLGGRTASGAARTETGTPDRDF